MSDGDVEALRAACEEAKGTLDHQMSWLQQMDTKAVKILRATLVLIGLLLTALSVSVRSNSVDISQFVNAFTLAGGLALVFASVGAAVTYIASSYEAGISKRDLEEALDNNYDEEKLHTQLVGGYANWIQFNQYVLQYNAILLTLTIIFVIDAIAFLTAGAAVGALKAAFTTPSLIIFAILCTLLLLLDFGVYKSESLVVWYFETRDGD